MQTIDYKELLSKYIAHVKQEDGNDFIAQMYFVGKTFTNEEKKALREIVKELNT